MNIACWVKRWSELNPEKRALVYEGRQFTYLELHQGADRTAAWLQSLGVKKGDRVAVMSANRPEFIEIYLACARLGAIFVPISFRLAPPELEHILRNARPEVLIFGKEAEQAALGLRPDHRPPGMLFSSIQEPDPETGVMDFQKETAAFEGEVPSLTPSLEPADPEEPHVIMYTSGTTGRPKGAVLSHRKTFFNCLNADIFFKLHFDDIMLIVLPLFHSGGLFIQASPAIYKGATIVLHPGLDPARVYADIEAMGVSKFLGVPTIYRALLRVGRENRGDLASLSVCAVGGEKTTPDLLLDCQEAGFPLRQVMGQTETSILLWASEEASIRKPGTVGRPVFHAEVDLVDEQGCRVRTGEVGELVVRGSIMMTEYWQDPVQTGKTIKNGWLHTGDLCVRDEEGYFYLKDRVTDMYISGGENVYPAEVEGVLREHPGVADVAVVGVPDESWGEVGQAYVIPRSGWDLQQNELIDCCEGRLASFKWPKRVVFCDAFPRTSLGKVRKKELASTVRTGEQAGNER